MLLSQYFVKFFFLDYSVLLQITSLFTWDWDSGWGGKWDFWGIYKRNAL